MTIAVLAAMGMEAARLRERIENAEPMAPRGKTVRGAVGAAAVILHRCGWGMRNAARGARAVIENYHPDALVLCGVSGGLLPNIRVGETFIASSAFPAWGKAREAFATDAKLADFAARVLEGARQSPVATSRGLILRKKRKLGVVLQSGAACIDMESWAVAKTAQEMGVPLLILRAISDTYRPSSLLAFFKNGALAAEKAAADTEAVLKKLAEGAQDG